MNYFVPQTLQLSQMTNIWRLCDHFNPSKWAIHQKTPTVLYVIYLKTKYFKTIFTTNKKWSENIQLLLKTLKPCSHFVDTRWEIVYGTREEGHLECKKNGTTCMYLDFFYTQSASRQVSSNDYYIFFYKGVFLPIIVCKDR